MPQKSKKAKIKAKMRHGTTESVKSSEKKLSIQNSTDTPVEKKNAFSFSFQAPKQSGIQKKESHTEDDSFPAIKRDLFKTVTLAVLSFIVLIGLSFILK